jgi:hypothetical protein
VGVLIGAGFFRSQAALSSTVADGMLRTEQGVGAFVTATEPVRAVTDLAATLTEVRDLITDALAAVRNPKGKVTFDLMDDDSHFVLETALRDIADRVRADPENDPDGADSRHRWARTVERMLTQINAALT